MEIEKLSKLVNEYLKEVGILTKEVEKEMENAIRWAYGEMIKEEIRGVNSEK